MLKKLLNEASERALKNPQEQISETLQYHQKERKSQKPPTATTNFPFEEFPKLTTRESSSQLPTVVRKTIVVYPWGAQVWLIEGSIDDEDKKTRQGRRLFLGKP